jgi:hypothetical protein
VSTSYHAKYFGHELTRRSGTDGVEKLSVSLFDAAVDLNPYQIEAALFAFRSPLSKGVLLADEVGLGKTIEAGLVLCQCWAERRRKLLVICPASLRKQWSMELSEKFHLPSVILDSATLYTTMQSTDRASTAARSRFRAGRSILPPVYPPSSKWSVITCQPSCFWLAMKASDASRWASSELNSCWSPSSVDLRV